MKIVRTAGGKTGIEITKSEWAQMGFEKGWAEDLADCVVAATASGLKVVAEGDWPKKLKKGRFTSYCKSQGFEGPCKACAEKAQNSDDASVRGMASFYMNTVKP
jgi:hypothetical protein